MFVFVEDKTVIMEWCDSCWC